MQRRIIGLAVLLAIAIASWSAGAYSESAQATYNAGTPMDAYMVESERLGEMNLLRLSAATGETMLMLIDSAGMPICLTTEKSAPADPDAEQTADDAIATALGAFPDAIILQVYSDEMYNTTLRLNQRKLWSRFFILTRKAPAGLLAASQGGLTQSEWKGCPQNRWIKLRDQL